MIDLEEGFAPLQREGTSQPSPCFNEDTWRALLPVPGDAPPLGRSLLNDFAPYGYSVTDGWAYRDKHGRLLGYAVRYDRPGNGLPADKEFRPFTFCEGPKGRREWRCQALPEPRPLYNLDHLAARPDAPVL